MRGEKWGFLRLDVVRQFPFPEDLSGHYIPESVVWCQVSKNFLTRHVNEVVRIYWTDAPSLVHGRPDPRRNAAGHRLWCQTVLDLESGWFFSAPLRLLRAAALYTRFSLHTGVSIPRQFRDLKSWGGRLLWLAALPVGLAVWLRDQWRK
ncbi:MAG: hypothetical protein JNG86_06380 [Verrucomicrobiaceae bacterium]|nr:hypothetical protein [Verrucomicrobiaceae bacterium]